MKKTENQCCGCAAPGYPCIDCGRKRIPVYYCDKCDPKCEEPLDEVYDDGEQELCEYCLLKKYRKEF